MVTPALAAALLAAAVLRPRGRALYGSLALFALAGARFLPSPVGTGLLLAAACTATAALARAGIAWSRRRRHHHLLRLAFPAAVEVLGMYTRAGLTAPQAVAAAADTCPPVMAPPLRQLAADWTGLPSLRHALLRFARAVPVPACMDLVSALLRGQQLGAPIADTLARFAEDLRRQHLHAWRRRMKARPYILTVSSGLLLLESVLLLALPGVLVLVQHGYLS